MCVLTCGNELALEIDANPPETLPGRMNRLLCNEACVQRSKLQTKRFWGRITRLGKTENENGRVVNIMSVSKATHNSNINSEPDCTLAVCFEQDTKIIVLKGSMDEDAVGESIMFMCTVLASCFP